MSRREVVGLDDLFAREEAPAAEPSRGWTRRLGGRWLLGRVFFSVALGTVIYGLLWVVRVGVPYGLIVVTIFAVTILRAAVARIDARPMPVGITGRGLGPPTDPQLATAVDADEGRTPDGMRIAVGRWDSRLNYPARDPERLVRVVLPRLREMADERLRLHHGFTMSTDPSRARRMLGEHAWKMFYEQPPRGGFSPQDLAALVERMEQL
jgi:hypothetical protein